MLQRSIGNVEQVIRYPVKSMAGQSLNRTHIATYGLYGDRSHAFVDHSKQGWDRYITARHIPGLLGYEPRFLEESSADEFPELVITSPDGRVFCWDTHMLDEIQSYTDRKLSMIRHQPGSSELLAVDTGAILIITDRSLSKLKLLTGSDIDPRRFRANLILSLHEDAAPDETEWVGKSLYVGTCRLDVVERCERCSVITMNPDTYERDVNILKQVNEHMDLCFGVYASVGAVGDVCVGDEVYLD